MFYFFWNAEIKAYLQWAEMPKYMIQAKSESKIKITYEDQIWIYEAATKGIEIFINFF